MFGLGTEKKNHEKNFTHRRCIPEGFAWFELLNDIRDFSTASVLCYFVKRVDPPNS